MPRATDLTKCCLLQIPLSGEIGVFNRTASSVISAYTYRSPSAFLLIYLHHKRPDVSWQKLTSPCIELVDIRPHFLLPQMNYFMKLNYLIKDLNYFCDLYPSADLPQIS